MPIELKALKKRMWKLSRDGQRRRRYPDGLKRDVVTYVAQRKAEGLTQSAACQEVGVHQGVVTDWVRALKKTQSGPGVPRKAGKQRLRQVEVAVGAGAAGPVVKLPGGLQIEGLDLDQVVTLVKALS